MDLAEQRAVRALNGHMLKKIQPWEPEQPEAAAAGPLLAVFMAARVAVQQRREVLVRTGVYFSPIGHKKEK
jgi:hypothetical protein